MAPTRSTRSMQSKQAVGSTTMTTLLPVERKGFPRRGAQNVQDQNVDIMQTRGKRKAEHSPVKNEKVKRSALGNLTNNVNKIMTTHPEEDAKQKLTKKKDITNPFGTQVVQVLKDSQNVNVCQQQQRQQQTKVLTRASSRNSSNSRLVDEQTSNVLTTVATAGAQKVQVKEEPPAGQAPVGPPVSNQQKVPLKHVRRISNEFNKTEESLYMSALEDVSSCESIRLSGNFEAARRRSALLQQLNQKTESVPGANSATTDGLSSVAHKEIPPGVEDFDKANWNDPFQVSQYAMDIFNYLKGREVDFPIEDYMQRQVHLSKWMRSLLVDWMVEVQETFELNHETLYLAVKIVDLFLCRVVINKEKLQLLGAAALFIACKFDERTPPLIEDFLYICDGAYKHDELIQMEMTTLRTINYDLGIPLSYRFLRRYARCAKVAMPTLTLARYILELSLMDYATISFSDSQMASAALFMALRLHGERQPWSLTLEYYSGYKLADFVEIIPVLNAGLHRKPKGTIKTIRSKYSHKIFHEVAKVPLMSTEQLLEHSLDLSEELLKTI